MNQSSSERPSGRNHISQSRRRWYGANWRGMRRTSPGLPLNSYSRQVAASGSSSVVPSTTISMRSFVTVPNAPYAFAELPAVEARVHQLPPREEVAQRPPAEHDDRATPTAVVTTSQGSGMPSTSHGAIRRRRRRPARRSRAGRSPRTASTIVAQFSHAKLPVTTSHSWVAMTIAAADRADDRRAPGPGTQSPSERREQEPRHDELREVVAEHLAPVEPRGGAGAPGG